MVAKLALIESEWPGAFERLVGRPRLLVGWEEEAEQGDEVDWEGGVGSAEVGEHEEHVEDNDDLDEDRDNAEEQHQRQSRRDFAAFLRQARSVQSKQAAAILQLKQPEKEVTLGYAEFRRALISSDRVQVEKILDEADNGATLAAQTVEILDQEVKDRFWVNARAVIDSVVSVPGLRPFENARREVLRRAARNPNLRRQLGLLDPLAVLHSLGLLSGTDREHLIDPFVERATDDQVELEARRAAADALAPLAAELNPAQRQKVSEMIASDQTDFPSYRKLAEAVCS